MIQSQPGKQLNALTQGAVIYFGYGIKFSNLELRMGQKATYKVGLDLDSDFDPNFAKTSNTKGGYQNFENEAE